ncbi:hypothetical protein [Thaumasiovibrio subtropicus]|uniref:hypothetical protein n=1 Tax=Thaumasiovibrio subtropicus TaxID=1891207 RepID=UPI000B34ACD2|nr:hypothetical protein [Thaumasiovibrio subtropicus]
MRSIILSLQKLLICPIFFVLAFVVGPLLMAVLLPGGLIMLAILGGKEVRKELGVLLRASLFDRQATLR